ncbi:Estradiol 17-beta-dehydrogenase 2 [Myotis davidii]|uniref:Estradiol 17-beta-dehydrogenase 2 n=1 Tax=Myotis davidii TaxID=225400 RepID=L5MIG8_MYODS|nr:Estradiol 17-beta-dehydrogenase 2 [Myotis davidii]
MNRSGKREQQAALDCQFRPDPHRLCSDSGIGHALSKYLDQLGFTVFAGVLNENGSGAEELRRTCSTRFSVLQLDVTDSQQIKDAYSKVVQKVQNRGLWAVVNNAGILGLPTDGELIPMIHYKRCMDVNFFGAVEVTKAFLPLLRKSKGRLVNISSMAGGVPLFKMAAYGSSKAALTMFSAVMRQELSKWEVKVSNIQPGGFKTSITGTSEMRDKLEKDILDHLTPDVQEEYGQDYILAQKNVFNAVSTYASSDVSPVLQDIQHAISAKSPFTFYTPGIPDPEVASPRVKAETYSEKPVKQGHFAFAFQDLKVLNAVGILNPAKATRLLTQWFPAHFLLKAVTASPLLLQMVEATPIVHLAIWIVISKNPDANIPEFKGIEAIIC